MHINQQHEKKIKYYTTTHLGTSDTYYTHKEGQPVHGSGQGSGNAGSEWSFISIPLMQLMEQKTENCEITGPTKTTWSQNIIGFVDDTRKYNNQNTTYPTIPENVRSDLLTWEKITELAGGAVNKQKCGYYSVTWQFNTRGQLTM